MSNEQDHGNKLGIRPTGNVLAITSSSSLDEPFPGRPI
jgi:hypothetical protein